MDSEQLIAVLRKAAEQVDRDIDSGDLAGAEMGKIMIVGVLLGRVKAEIDLKGEVVFSWSNENIPGQLKRVK